MAFLRTTSCKLKMRFFRPKAMPVPRARLSASLGIEFVSATPDALFQG